MTLMTSDADSAMTSHWFHLPGRGVLRLSGPDRVAFLQGLVSNDVARIGVEAAVYACLLTPQGKFLHDLFLIADGDTILIDCEAARSDDLARRLRQYRLRSRVELTDASQDYLSYVCLGDTPVPTSGIVFRDPRIAVLGHRLLAAPSAALPDQVGSSTLALYERLRIALAVPDGSRDMEVGKAILLENNIDLLNGIAWDKGCYMGQELTARTRYRGLIKKRLAPVRISGMTPPVGTPLIENGVEVGEMRTSAGDIGLALIKLEILRQNRPITIEGAILVPELPGHFPAFGEAP